MRSKQAIRALVMLLGVSMIGMAQQTNLGSNSQLKAAYRLQDISTGVTTSRNGRVFALLSHLNGGWGTRIVELAKDGTSRPYPDAAWNTWKEGQDPSHAFVAVNALRMGPDGLLWIVDTGAHGFGTPVVPGGAKLVVIDIQKNAVRRVYPLDAAIGKTSYVDDIRFHGTNAYLTDAGVPGIIVLDLPTGRARRVLDHDVSTTARRPLRASGAVLMLNGAEIRINADQLEVSPDGRWFYYQPACGPMYRVETRYLDNPKLPAKEVAAHAHPWAETPSTGGTVIDADGNIYVSDLDTRTIFKYTPDGKRTVLIRDPKLDWVDAMWIDWQGNLWMPAAQLDQTATFQGGVSRIHYPIVLYTMPIGHKPQY